MRQPPDKNIRLFIALFAAIFLCGGLVCCRSLTPISPHTGTAPQTLGGGILSNPFKPVDPIAYTRTKAAAALMEQRVKPAAAHFGSKPLTIQDCRGLTLANNLELQAARMEEVSRKAIEFSNRTKLLPHFSFSSELSERDNLAYSYSDQGGNQGNPPGFQSGGQVSNWAVGRERSTWRYVLESRWSPTDAALAYYLTLSSGNDRLAAHFQKVRIAQKLTGVVDSAFYRLLCLQQCIPMAKQLVDLRKDISQRMEGLLNLRLRTVEDCERARQGHTKAIGLLALLENEKETQINILASAMGVSPESCAGLNIEGALPIPALDDCLATLEMTAVQNRPEAFQAGLNNLNSLEDLKRSIIKNFPRVTAFWRTTHDKDKYIYNKDWNDVGMTIYFDLLDFLSGMGEWKASRAKTSKTEMEVGAVALGITSQVRIAALKSLHAISQLKNADVSVTGSKRVYDAAMRSYSANASDKLSADEANGNYLGEAVSRMRALGEANAMLAELYAAMGTNYSQPLPKD